MSFSPNEKTGTNAALMKPRDYRQLCHSEDIKINLPVLDGDLDKA
jgi:hypothetical protein